MRIVKQPHAVAQIVLYDAFHFLGERAGITYRRPFLNARGEGDGIGSPSHQFPCPQHSFLARASAAVRESYNLYLLLYTGEYARLVSDCLEVSRPRTEVFGLHTSDDSKFHIALY